MTIKTFKTRLQALEDKKKILEAETFALLRQYEIELTRKHEQACLV